MGATIDINVYWTGEDYAADTNTYDWQNPTGNNWRLVSDDSALGVGNYPGATGCTLNFLDGTAGLPDTNLPNAGEIFDLVIDGASMGTAWVQNLLTFCGVGNWDYSALTVGADGRHADTITFDKDSAVGGTITIYGQTGDDSVPTAIAEALITVKSGGILHAYTTAWTISKVVTLEAGGVLWILGHVTLLANGGLNLAGTLNIARDSSVLDVASPGGGVAPILCTGDCEILWGGAGGGDIIGGLDAGIYTVTHTDAAAGNSITCDETANLNLGGVFGGDVVITAGTVTVTANQSMGSLTGSDGTFVDGGYTITLSRSVDTSAITLTSTGKLLLAGTGTIKTKALTQMWAEVQIEGTYTTGANDSSTKKLSGAGNFVVNHLFLISPSANDYLSFTGSITGSNTLHVYNPATKTLSRDISVACHFGFHVSTTQTNTPGVNITIYGGKDLLFALDGIGSVFTLNIPISSLKVAGTVRLGRAGGGSGGNVLKLGSGAHVIGGLVTRHATNPENALHLESCLLECSGTLNGADIAVSAAADNVVHIVCTGAGAVSNADPAQIVHCHGGAGVDGGGNNTVNNKMTFNTYAHPGSLRMMGVGI